MPVSYTHLEQVKEAFGELRFMGADNCYRYDKDSKKKTEEGYDYTFYDQEFQELDGGIYDTFDAVSYTHLEQTPCGTGQAVFLSLRG